MGQLFNKYKGQELELLLFPKQQRKYGGYADSSARNGIFRANVFIPLEDMDLWLSDKAG